VGVGAQVKIFFANEQAISNFRIFIKKIGIRRPDTVFIEMEEKLQKCQLNYSQNWCNLVELVEYFKARRTVSAAFPAEMWRFWGQKSNIV